ncbi:LOW QUALITY PROTEIN: hypothetical protein CVT26_005213 [Gymnopilus dilepis]|uniref:Extracellular membrane protein CFEM domain-containing protein n=1 Tax=Gymnopilus dilepis TaxID=231916 RepID=A0A409YVM2_9AGAR|nr:LOW QUALITY PROTEIN: hypothetical protein CVT26_005213 [Gymnopilus dilepis]
MYSATFVGFFALALSAWQRERFVIQVQRPESSDLQVVKRQPTRTGILLPRESSVSCQETSIANNLQPCVNCLLEDSPDATTLTNVNGIVTGLLNFPSGLDFDTLCSSFPVPAVVTAGSISTPADHQVNDDTIASPTPKPNTNSVTTPITSPGGAGTTLPAHGGSATTPASSELLWTSRLHSRKLEAALTARQDELRRAACFFDDGWYRKMSDWAFGCSCPANFILGYAFRAIERNLPQSLLPRQDSTAVSLWIALWVMHSGQRSIPSATRFAPGSNRLYQSTYILCTQSCNTTACICSKAHANNLQQCINCVLETGNDAPGVVSSTEQVVSPFEVVCSKSSIPFVTVSNTTGSVSSSSSPGVATGPSSNAATQSVTSITHLPPPTNALTMPVTIHSSDISGPSKTDVSPSTSTSGPAGSGGTTDGSPKRSSILNLLVSSTVINIAGIIALL